MNYLRWQGPSRASESSSAMSSSWKSC